MQMKTFMAKAETVQRDWWVVDAEGKSLGRLAVEVAILLRGKHTPIFTPHCDAGDHVIVINADKVVLSGNKGEEKIYWHSQYPGGLKSTTKANVLAKRPERLVEKTIKGMLPHNKLGAQIYRKLRVYPGATHPHQGQNPQAREIQG
jgi:large subunit ribosomal protein L13